MEYIPFAAWMFYLAAATGCGMAVADGVRNNKIFGFFFGLITFPLLVVLGISFKLTYYLLEDV
mgnify:CR=1 FL=1